MYRDLIYIGLNEDLLQILENRLLDFGITPHDSVDNVNRELDS